MKKIVSFILTLAMVLGVFSIPVAAETQEQAFGTAETFAFALNITDRESYQPGKLITRAEFADLVYRLLNFANISSDDNSWYNENYGEDTKDELLVLGDTKIFEDVDKAVPQYDAIKYVSDNGLMNGMTPEIFGPSYDITTASVAKVMVNILGYEEVAQNKGGYPNGYMTVASSLKLLSGISAGANEFITLRECLTMFHNALDVKMFDLDYISGDGEVVLTKGKDSFLTRGLGLVNVYGIVEDTGITTMYGASSVGEEMAVIDGVKVYVGNCTDIRSYIGREVDAYCLEGSNGIYTLKFIEPLDDGSITFSSRDFVSYNNSVIEYVDANGKVKTAKMASKNKIKVVYNGKALKQYTTDIFSFPYGDITLISVNGSDYDLVVIRDYAVGKVVKVRPEDSYVYAETLYKGMHAVKYLQLDKDDKLVSLKNETGKEIEAGQVNSGNVISAMISTDGEYIEAIVSNSVVSGFVVETVSETDSDILYTSGENEYVLTQKDKLADVPAIKLNKAYNLYFDHEGRLAYVDQAGEDTSGEKAAFITGVDSASNGFTSDYKIRMYTEDGLMVIYDFEDRIKLNGNSYKIEDAIDEIRAAANAQKAVLYEADTKTKLVKSITLPLEFGADDKEKRGWYHISPDAARLSLDVGQDAAGDEWKANIDTYGLKWFVNGYTFGKLMFWDKTITKTMSVPNSVEYYDDERNFMVQSGTAPFGNTDIKFLVHGYSRDAKAMTADLLVYATAEQGAEKVVTTSFFVLEKMTNKLDSKGDNVKQLTGYEVVLSPMSCKKVSYTVDDNTYFSKLKFNDPNMYPIDPDNYDIKVDGPAKVEDLGAGDILRFSKSADGVLRSVFVNYDASQNLYFCRTPISSKAPFEGEMNINLGYPLYTTGTYVRMADTGYLPEDMEQNPENLLDPTKLMAHNVGTKPVVVVEETAGRVTLRQGTIEDILTYEDTGVLPEYDKVAGILYGGLTIGTVVYKAER